MQGELFPATRLSLILHAFSSRPLPNLIISCAIPVIFVALWSTGFIGSKYGTPYAEPLGFLALRFFIAALLLSVVLLVIRNKTDSRLSRQDMLHAAIAGVLLQAVYLGGVFSAIAVGIGAGLSALIVGLQPLATVFLARLWLGEALTVKKLLGITLGLAGVVIVVVARGLLQGQLSTAGLLYCVAALLGITMGSLYQKRYCQNLPLLPSVTIQYAASVVVLLPLAAMTETLRFDWQPTFILALGWLIFALSLGAVFILMWLIRRGEAGRVAALFYLVPPVVAIEAWLLFDESLSAGVAIGTLLCIAGVALVMLPGTNDRQQPE